MRYEDTSGTLSAAGTPDARDDADLLPSGSHAPATGNVISGAGTTTGQAGADTPSNGLVVALRGAGGTDSSDSGASLHVAGRYGTLTMDEHGNYKYVPEARAPSGVRDVFNYTLETKGGRDTAELVINLGDRIQVSENAQRVVPGPDGVVNLPPGVTLSDVHVVGRDLVVTLPDGSQIIIVDGAVFVPQLVLGGVEVPSTNLATLLIENEQVLRPIGGPPQSSGGNFDVPVPPLDPGTPLGDLIPPTELIFGQPRFEEIGQVLDRKPEAGAASAQLDDDAQPGGNPGGIGDDPGGSLASGSLPGSGGDGSLHWALVASGTLPSGFSFQAQANGDVWVLQGATHVLTISVNPNTGGYTVTQIHAINHPAGGDENNLEFVINFRVTDQDGDTAVGTLTINVDDDTPVVSVTAGPDANVILTTHDHLTIGSGQESVSTSANFSGVFSGTSVSYGADGPGAGSSDVYALSTTGGASGLFSHGVAINLYNVAGVIVGSTATSAAGITTDNTIFTVSTTNTGIVTLTQFQQIDHTNTDPTPTGAPFEDHSISLADNLITLTRTVTAVDGDGDHASGSASVQIGANLRFLDDGPTISIADRGEPTLTVDETDLGTNASASFAANFAANFGADGPAGSGSITYALGINAGATGLIDVATGQAIVLVLNGGVVEGHVGSAAGALAFTVSVDSSGTVTLDQIRALQHPDGSNPDDSVTLANDNLVTLTATAHDFDGDTASASLNIGQNLNFKDDGPSIVLSGSEPTLTVDETNLAINATASVAGAFTGAFGADGAGTITYALGITGGNGVASGLIDVATGLSIVLVNNGGVIEGHVGNAAGAIAFTVSIDSSGVVTLDQVRALQHPNPANPDDSVTLANDNLITVTGTITDKDGDTASAVLNLGQNLVFKDDGPSISLSGSEPSLTVDETNLAINATAGFAGAFSSSFGADGAGTVAYALSITGGNGTDSGLIDVATGQHVLLSVNGSGVIEGRTAVGGDLVFTVSVDASGNVTLDQIRALQHPNPANPDDNVTLANDNLVVLTATVTDKDGDQASAALNIGQNLNFKDDGPSISASSEQPSLTVDETNLAINASASFAGVFTSSFGADGAGTITYALGITGGNGTSSGLIDVATGLSIVLVNNAGVIEGHVGNAAGALAFTVSIDSSGVVTLDQIRALQHPNPANPDDSVTLANDNLITITATITDRDGDQATAVANIGQNLNFKDDGPSISASTTQPILTVDETVLATNATASFAGVFTSSFGADGAGTITYALAITGGNGTNSGLVDTATGSAIVLVNNAGVIEGHVGNAAGPLAFTVTVDASGNVTLDQIRAVIHPNPANPDDSVTLSADNLVTLTATVTDKDGDSQSAVANIGQNLVFKDDGPSANNDSDTIASGGSTAIGNVVTGVGTNEGAANADNPGADGFGSVTTIHSNGTGTTDTTFSAGVLSVVGTYGTLEMDANGNYTYTRASGSPGDVSETFTYTYIDKDGDPATATLTITINDAAPTAGSVSVGLDDDALAGGNPMGIGDDPDSVNATGTLPGSGGDGALTWGLLLTGAPAGFSYVSGGAGIVLVQQNGTTVLTITVNSSNGSYSVVQNHAIDHQAGGDENNQPFTVNYTVTDQDGDVAPGTINISVDDDTPVISASTTQPTLTVDETNLAINASASFAGVFTNSFGADGPAAANSITYALGITGGNGVASGLFDVATGLSIVLVNNAGVIEGHVGNAAGALAFTVSVDSSGVVTLDQIRAITHPNAANPDDSVTLANDNLVTLSSTITDHDGDSATATANIGQNLVFKDDGPSISASTTQPILTVDETNLAVNATASFASVFTSSFGADGAGTITYALGITGGSGVASGLIDVATGSNIVLVVNGAVVEGHVGNAAGALAFTVSVDSSGNVTLDQIRAVQHPNAANPDDSVTLANDNLVTLTATITDKDGDQASAIANIGQNLVFKDDGPSISASTTQPILTVDETNLAINASASFAAVFTPVFGADGAAASNSVAYALAITGGNGVASGLVDVATGSSIVLVNNAGVIEGHVGNAAGALAFTVSVDSSGVVTLDQIRAVQHPNAADPDDSVTLANDNLITLTATATDRDGDQASATANIGQNLVFKDDGPSISASTTQPILTVDETSLATDASASFAAVFTSSFGADGAGTITYALGITGGNGTLSGLVDTATGQNIVLVNNAGVIEGHVGNAAGALAFTVSVNSSGVVTLDQIRAVVHPNAANPDDSVTLANDNLVTLTGTITDKDGDQASATANIGQNLVFKDDGPSISTTGAEPTLTVDETVLATNATQSFAANFTSSFGADGAGTLTYALTITGGNGTASGLVDTATGQPIVLVNNAGVIEGHVGTQAGALAFTVSVNGSGSVTLDQIRAVVHPNTANPNDSVTLSADNLIVLTATITDKDGDSQSASLNIGQNMIFLDDGPSIGTVQNQQTDNNPATAPAVGTLHFTPGADGAGSTMTITANNTGITSGGHALLTVQTGNVLTAYQDTNNDGIHQVGETTVVYTLTVNPTAGTSGQYVFDLVTPLDPTVVDTPIGSSSSFGAGPTLGQVLSDASGTTPLSVVSGYHPTGSFNVASWMSGTALSGTTVTSAGVNGSTAGWGVDNNNFESGSGGQELMFFDFGNQALADPDGGGSFVPPGVSLPDITFAKFDFISYKAGAGNAGDDIAYVVHFTDGTSVSGWVPDVNINGATWTFSAPAGKFIADITFYSGVEPDGTTVQNLGPGKIDLVSVGVTSSSINVTPSFTVQLTDGDGDPTATAAFNVHVATGLVPFSPAAPVVLDLNGDGVHFLGTDAGVTYNYGHGQVATAWASPEDGILVNDANRDGNVSASEFVFGGNGMSDLQALSAYDTNHDGQLSADDADFGNFAVWQDANSNGVVDAGELQSLGARGIASISLSSDGIRYSAAGGDVTVVGTGSYTRTDGSTGSLADAEFLTGATRPAANNNAILMGALAAAGLAASSAATAVTHASLIATTALTGVHNQALTPIALDQSSFDMHSSALLSPQIDVRGMMELQSSIFHAPNHGETPLSLIGNAPALPSQSPVEFHQGTQVPVHDQVLSAVALGGNVAIPSAQQLAGLSQGGLAGAQHNQIVAQVLADALHSGGANGATLDALVNALPGHGGGANGALASLASQNGAPVSFGDMGGFPGFGGAHFGLPMEHAVMAHQDAAPLHA